MGKRIIKSENKHNRAWMRLVRHYAQENMGYEDRRNYTHEQICAHWEGQFLGANRAKGLTPIRKQAYGPQPFHKVYEALWGLQQSFQNDKYVVAIQEEGVKKVQPRVKEVYFSLLRCVQSSEFLGWMEAHSHNGFEGVYKKSLVLQYEQIPKEYETPTTEQMEAFLVAAVMAPQLHETFSNKSERDTIRAYYRVLVQALSRLDQSALLNFTGALIKLDHGALDQKEKSAIHCFFESISSCDAYVHRLLSPSWLPLDYKKQLRAGSLVINPLSRLITQCLYQTGYFKRNEGGATESVSVSLMMNPVWQNEQALRVQENYFYRYLPIYLGQVCDRIKWSASEKKHLQISHIRKLSDRVEEHSVLRSVLGHYHYGQGGQSEALLHVQYDISKMLLKVGFNLTKEEQRQIEQEDSALRISLPHGSFAFYKASLEQQMLQQLVVSVPKEDQSAPKTARL